MEGEKDPVCAPIDPAHPEQSEFLRYSLDLLNAGYFWESHVYFESLWNAHGRKGSVADFLKGMIKLGAAGVKVSIEQKAAALGHYDRAKELFLSVKNAEGETFLGFNLSQLIHFIEMVSSQGVKLPEIHPNWE